MEPKNNSKRLWAEGLEDCVDDMIAKGWVVKRCDTPVPFYDVKVKCGRPTDVGYAPMSAMMLPEDYARCKAVYFVIAEGDSMIDAGIEEGDMVWTQSDVEVYDGEIVVASIDNEYTIKTYCEDEDGTPWLVPQNKAYEAFPMSGDNVRILGKVMNVVKRVPHIPTRECMADIRKAKRNNQKRKKYSKEEILEIIRTIAPMVESVRQWFAVYKPIEEIKAIGKKDYGSFVMMVREVVPNHPHLPGGGKDISCMDVQSFANGVDSWREAYAPVQGKRFNDYKKIAEKTKSLL